MGVGSGEWGTQGTVGQTSQLSSNSSTGDHSGCAGYTFNLSRRKQIFESHNSLGGTMGP